MPKLHSRVAQARNTFRKTIGKLESDQHDTVMHQIYFVLRWRLNLQNNICLGVHRLRIINDPGVLEVLIGETGRGTRITFDQNFGTEFHEPINGPRIQRNTTFIGVLFPRDTYFYWHLSILQIRSL